MLSLNFGPFSFEVQIFPVVVVSDQNPFVFVAVGDLEAVDDEHVETDDDHLVERLREFDLLLEFVVTLAVDPADHVELSHVLPLQQILHLLVRAQILLWVQNLQKVVSVLFSEHFVVDVFDYFQDTVVFDQILVVVHGDQKHGLVFQTGHEVALLLDVQVEGVDLVDDVVGGFEVNSVFVAEVVDPDSFLGGERLENTIFDEAEHACVVVEFVFDLLFYFGLLGFNVLVVLFLLALQLQFQRVGLIYIQFVVRNAPLEVTQHLGVLVADDARNNVGGAHAFRTLGG
mmetsp:Transcript_71590/g.154500  ORF Transcript_71590/g.154500 Transcript_71590/m.154500 type:complete len:286 (+) Transcript_71590:144-1001(+)